MISINNLPNGIIFDTTGLPESGSRYPIKKFIPKNNVNIADVQLFTNVVVITDITGCSQTLNLEGSAESYPISEVNDVAVISVTDLFDKLIAIL